MARKTKLGVSFQELLLQYSEGDSKARDMIINYYMKKAYKIACEYFHLGLDDEDVVLAAYEGLVVEVSRLKGKDYSNPSKSLDDKIEGYVRNAIINFYGFNDEKGATSQMLKSSLMKVLIAKRDLLSINGKPPTLEQISEKTSISVEKVKWFLDLLSKVKYVGLFRVTLDEMNPYQYVVNEDLLSIIYEILKVEDFTLEERLVIEERYLLGYQKTFRDLAKELNCSHNNVLKIEQRALRKIRNSSIFKDYLSNSDFSKIYSLK